MEEFYSYDRRQSAVQTLDLTWIEGLRKDFLVLLKNLPRVKDYKTAHLLRAAFSTYRTRFDELFFEHFLNRDLKYNLGLSDGDASWLGKKLRTVAWQFSTELRVPISFADQYNSEGVLFARYEAEAPQWKTRVQRRAQAFWKDMKETVEWFERVQQSPINVKVPTVEKTVVEGFQLIMRGYDESDEYHREGLANLREGLRLYRKKAAAVAPILMKKQLPVIMEFESKLDKGGQYNHDGTIQFWVTSAMEKGPPWVAHAMAHEMGHHLWQTDLSKDAQTFWHQTIMGDYGDLDIQELVNNWPGNAWAFEFSKSIGNKDPILALQVESLSHDQFYKDLQTKEDFQKLLDTGKKTLHTPKHPITGYANKNPEEAFCETIGMLVAYGPRAIHEQVRQWMHIALPGEIKVASLAKIAGFFNVDDPVTYGKYKNKKGIIRRLFLDEKGHPSVEIEPVPKGRKKNKVFGLYKIWHAPESKTAMSLSQRVVSRYLQAKREADLGPRVKNAFLQKKYANLGIGKTLETGKWRVHRYNDSLTITDLTNAGKRGKKVTNISLQLSSQVAGRWSISEATQDEILLHAKRDATLDRMLQAIKELKEVGFDSWVEEKRGVDVMPAGFSPIEVNGDKVYVQVGLKDFTVRDKQDQNNDPTCIPAMKGGLKAIPMFYRWVQDNESKIKSMTFSEVLKQMDTLDVPYHYYCAVD